MPPFAERNPSPPVIFVRGAHFMRAAPSHVVPNSVFGSFAKSVFQIAVCWARRLCLFDVLFSTGSTNTTATRRCSTFKRLPKNNCLFSASTTTNPLFGVVSLRWRFRRQREYSQLSKTTPCEIIHGKLITKNFQESQGHLWTSQISQTSLGLVETKRSLGTIVLRSKSLSEKVPI